MGLKNYLRDNNMTITRLSKSSGVPYSTVNDIVNGKTDIDKVMTGITVRLASVCEMTFDEFYAAVKSDHILPVVENGEIVIKNKRYYVRYFINGKWGESYLFKVNQDTTQFVKTAAEWEISSAKREAEYAKNLKEMNEWAKRITS